MKVETTQFNARNFSVTKMTKRRRGKENIHDNYSPLTVKAWETKQMITYVVEERKE